jgi:hypothetical protein
MAPSVGEDVFDYTNSFSKLSVYFLILLSALFGYFIYLCFTYPFSQISAAVPCKIYKPLESLSYLADEVARSIT